MGEENQTAAPTEAGIPATGDSPAVDPQVMEAGQQQYMICAACHGPQGQGVPGLAPPLAGSEWVTGSVENLILIQMRGLQGPITVAGTEFTGVMPPNAHLSDEQIANVLTYVRNSWGNTGTPVTPDQVAEFRGEVGKEMLTAADLETPPTPGTPSTDPEQAEAVIEQPAPDNPYELKGGIDLSGGTIAFLIVWVVICFVPFLRKSD